RPEGKLATRISRNLRFGLFHMLNLYSNATKFIILEDDLIVAPDFYGFMQQTGVVMDQDKSVYCVSGFNHLSYAHTAKDPAQVYRIEFGPSYGWMTSREVLHDVLPKWLPSNITHDWDHVISSPVIRQGRECLVPDINRSYHGGIMGHHASASYRFEKNYLNRTINKLPYVKIMDTSKLLKESYESEMVSLFKKATSVKIEDIDNFTLPFSETGVYVICVKKSYDEDSINFRIVGEALNVWNKDARESHHHTWRLHYNNATLLVVGVPSSKYFSVAPKDCPVLKTSTPKEAEDELEKEDAHAREDMPIFVHRIFPYITDGGRRISLFSKDIFYIDTTNREVNSSTTLLSTETKPVLSNNNTSLNLASTTRPTQ
ncbi:unnamed protein product, partial [Meganyctiphanes norvegica]